MTIYISIELCIERMSASTIPFNDPSSGLSRADLAMAGATADNDACQKIGKILEHASKPHFTKESANMILAVGLGLLDDRECGRTSAQYTRANHLAKAKTKDLEIERLNQARRLLAEHMERIGEHSNANFEASDSGIHNSVIKAGWTEKITNSKHPQLDAAIWCHHVIRLILDKVRGDNYALAVAAYSGNPGQANVGRTLAIAPN